VREFIERSEAWFSENSPKSMTAIGTGPTVMFSHVAERNVNQMLKGNAIAIGLISIILVFALRSPSLGALSLIPNSLPILITFGIWAVTVNMVGMAAATVTSTSLGIVVDDTVHFLSKYLYARRDKGMTKRNAIRYAFNTVGSALVSTTIVLSVGFGVLAFSAFKINQEMGMLTSIAIVVAFVFDFTVLPALLLIGDKAEENETQDQPDEEQIPATA
jgi:predicted RND superfamily exporter protein